MTDLQRFAEAHAYTYRRSCPQWACAKDSYEAGFKKAIELAGKCASHTVSLKKEILHLADVNINAEGCPLCLGYPLSEGARKTEQVMEKYNQGSLCTCSHSQPPGIHTPHCEGIDKARELLGLPEIK